VSTTLACSTLHAVVAQLKPPSAHLSSPGMLVPPFATLQKSLLQCLSTPLPSSVVAAVYQLLATLPPNLGLDEHAVHAPTDTSEGTFRQRTRLSRTRSSHHVQDGVADVTSFPLNTKGTILLSSCAQDPFGHRPTAGDRAGRRRHIATFPTPNGPSHKRLCQANSPSRNQDTAASLQASSFGVSVGLGSWWPCDSDSALEQGGGSLRSNGEAIKVLDRACATLAASAPAAAHAAETFLLLHLSCLMAQHPDSSAAPWCPLSGLLLRATLKLALPPQINTPDNSGLGGVQQRVRAAQAAAQIRQFSRFVTAASASHRGCDWARSWAATRCLTSFVCCLMRSGHAQKSATASINWPSATGMDSVLSATTNSLKVLTSTGAGGYQSAGGVCTEALAALERALVATCCSCNLCGAEALVALDALLAVGCARTDSIAARAVAAAVQRLVGRPPEEVKWSANAARALLRTALLVCARRIRRLGACWPRGHSVVEASQEGLVDAAAVADLFQCCRAFETQGWCHGDVLEAAMQDVLCASCACLCTVLSRKQQDEALVGREGWRVGHVTADVAACELVSSAVLSNAKHVLPFLSPSKPCPSAEHALLACIECMHADFGHRATRKAIARQCATLLASFLDDSAHAMVPDFAAMRSRIHEITRPDTSRTGMLPTATASGTPADTVLTMHQQDTACKVEEDLPSTVVLTPHADCRNVDTEWLQGLVLRVAASLLECCSAQRLAGAVPDLSLPLQATSCVLAAMCAANLPRRVVEELMCPQGQPKPGGRQDWGALLASSWGATRAIAVSLAELLLAMRALHARVVMSAFQVAGEPPDRAAAGQPDPQGVHAVCGGDGARARVAERAGRQSGGEWDVDGLVATAVHAGTLGMGSLCAEQLLDESWGLTSFCLRACAAATRLAGEKSCCVRMHPPSPVGDGNRAAFVDVHVTQEAGTCVTVCDGPPHDVDAVLEAMVAWDAGNCALFGEDDGGRCTAPALHLGMQSSSDWPSAVGLSKRALEGLT
jgi:hypothetical protein